MTTAIIIDDEQNARDFLEKLIYRYFGTKIIILQTCDSVQTGVTAILTHKPELVFLDIQMPNENGFELFKYFDTVNFEVIFTTAYKDYAIDAIKHSALDYLLKPINYIDLLATLKRYEKNKESKNRQERIAILLENMNLNNSDFNKIALPTSNGYELVKLNTIMYCQSESNYCKICCLDGKEILLAKTLKYVEELLHSDLFIRIHKSFLVNLNYVEKFDRGNEMKVTLVNNKQLPVSIRKKEQFIDAILHKKK